ncbi:MAG: hypothetical protein KC487_10335 [Anaerolineae bacterium]|nr:hypothetical protein [Anaerolineae bacterium]
MNTHTFAQLQSLLTSKVSFAAETLRNECSEHTVSQWINHGSWSNDAGIMVAYISCNLDHDRSKDAIEATWQITPDQEFVILQGDICRSNGEIISSILDTRVDFAGADSAAIQEVRSLLDAGLAESLVQLKDILSC